MANDSLLTMMDEVFPNAAKLAMSIANFAAGGIFEFMPTETYEQLLINNPVEAARVYWREILYRAHLAAVTALARHARWISACLQHDGTEANYLGLATCLRGLLESAADTFYSLRSAPLTIASSMEMIEQAILGRLQRKDYLAEDLEHLLIHFIYARKLDGKASAPAGHRAETAAAYVQCLLDSNDDSVRRMYGELCGLTHPSASSVIWMLKTSDDFAHLQFGGTDDRRCIRQLIERNSKAIEVIATIPLNISICTLRVLNRLPLPEVHVPISEAYEPAGWDKVLLLLDGAGPSGENAGQHRP